MLNKSKSKQKYTFSKAERFPINKLYPFSHLVPLFNTLISTIRTLQPLPYLNPIHKSFAPLDQAAEAYLKTRFVLLPQNTRLKVDLKSI